MRTLNDYFILGGPIANVQTADSGPVAAVSVPDAGKLISIVGNYGWSCNRHSKFLRRHEGVWRN